MVETNEENKVPVDEKIETKEEVPVETPKVPETPIPQIPIPPVKRELTHEEKVELLNQEIRDLKEAKEIGILVQERNKIKKEINSQKIESVTDELGSIGNVLGGIFKGIPALGTDLQPIDNRQKTV